MRAGFLVILVISLAVLVARIPSPVRPLSLERAAVDGKFEQLSFGNTYYRIHGPVNSSKPRVVLIHGFSLGSDYTWGTVPTLLAGAGYRVLTFDLWGRGLSDEPGIHHSMAAFSSQTAELVLSLPEFRKDPFILIGISMGGAVAAKFTDTHPEMVQKLILIAPAGTSKLPTPLPVRILLLPVVGELTLNFAPFLMERELMAHVERSFSDPAAIKEYIAGTRDLIQYNLRNHAGFLRALLSTLRHSRLSDGIMEGEFERIGKQKRDILLIWGDLDIVVPFANSVRVQELLPGAKFVKLENVSHSIPEEFPELLVDAMTQWLGH